MEPSVFICSAECGHQLLEFATCGWIDYSGHADTEDWPPTCWPVQLAQLASTQGPWQLLPDSLLIKVLALS